MDLKQRILNSVFNLYTNEKKEIIYEDIYYEENSEYKLNYQDFLNIEVNQEKDNFGKLKERLDEIKNRIKTKFKNNYCLNIQLKFQDQGTINNTEEYQYNVINCELEFYAPNNELLQYKIGDILNQGLDSRDLGFFFFIENINNDDFKDIKYEKKTNSERRKESKSTRTQTKNSFIVCKSYYDILESVGKPIENKNLPKLLEMLGITKNEKSVDFNNTLFNKEKYHPNQNKPDNIFLINVNLNTSYENQFIDSSFRFKISNNLYQFTSNSILQNGKDCLSFKDINNNIIKDYKGYSFLLSKNNSCLIKGSDEEKYAILCACKKYKKNQKNGIILINITLFYQENIEKKFYPTKNFEVYCFCQISKLIDKKIIQDKKNNELIVTNYFLVGGLDLDRKKGLIKLYYFNPRRNEFEFIANITKIIEEEKKKEIRGPIICILQSPKEDGNIIVISDNGKVYTANTFTINLDILDNLIK